MTHVAQSIDVDVPAEQVYGVVTDPHSIPKFLSLVSELEPVGADEARWTVEVAGKRASFNAKQTVNDAPNHARYESQSARVPFTLDMRTEAISPTSTRLTIEAEFDAGGMAEKLGLAKGIANTALKSQLSNAKNYLEKRFEGGVDSGV